MSAIVVTIDRIDVQVAGSGWSTLTSTPETIDRRKLQGGTFETLGITMPPGRATTRARRLRMGPTWLRPPTAPTRAA